MRHPNIIASLLVCAFAMPLTFVFARAVADATTRSEEAPFRSVLGNERFEALMTGEGGFPHYLGDELRAPDFTLQDRDGKPWKLSDHRGKVIVMNFWTVTCRPCLREMPTLERLARFAESWGDTEVVAVTTDQSWDIVRPVVGSDARMTHLFDPERSVVTDMFGTKLYPETWIIDRDGIVRFRYDGGLDWASAIVLDMISAYR